MDLINKQAAVDALEEGFKDVTKGIDKLSPTYGLTKAITGIYKCLIGKLPSAQPEIIYCEDCKYKDDGIDENGIPFLKCLHGRSYGGTRINDFCSWAEKKEDAESRWIPVTERLPEEDKDVLCKTLGGVIFVASYGKLHQWTDEKGWIITPSLERAGISFVDYWMPLPEFKKGWKND